jgi:hypothetical protein
MAEQVLDDAKVRAPLQHVGSHCAAQRVGMNPSDFGAASQPQAQAFDRPRPIWPRC